MLLISSGRRATSSQQLTIATPADTPESASWHCNGCDPQGKAEPVGSSNNRPPRQYSRLSRRQGVGARREISVHSNLCPRARGERRAWRCEEGRPLSNRPDRPPRRHNMPRNMAQGLGGQGNGKSTSDAAAGGGLKVVCILLSPWWSWWSWCPGKSTSQR